MEDTATAGLNESIYTNKSINLLANGLIQLHKPSLVKTKQQLKDLTQKQSIVVDQLHNENLKLAATQHSFELQEMFNLIKVYNVKLQNIKKSMVLLHDKTNKLKKRSLRLQHMREKDVYIANKVQTLEPNQLNTSKNST